MKKISDKYNLKLINNQLIDTSHHDYKSFVRSILYGDLAPYSKDVNQKDALLVLIYLLGIFAPEYVYRFDCSINSKIFKHPLACLIKERLVTKENGLNDGFSSIYYTISNKGFYYLKKNFLDSKLFSQKPAKTTSYWQTLKHNYSAGINVLSLISQKRTFDFTIISETNLGSDENKRAWISKEFRPDLIIRVDREKNTRFLYVEQDMGTEHASVLIDKLLSYAKSDVLLLNSSNILFISRRASYANTYSRRIHPLLDENRIKSIIDIMKKRKISTLSELKDAVNNSTDLFLFVDAFIKTVDDMHLSKLETFYTDLKCKRNSYLLKDFNKRQYLLAKKTLKSITSSLDACFDLRISNERKHTYSDNKESISISDKLLLLNSFYRGVCCLVVATDLMPRYLSVSLNNPHTIYKKLLLSLSFISKDTLKSRFFPLSKDLIKEYKETFNDGPKMMASMLKLRNTFVLKTGKTISFEYLSHDIGARYRIIAFYENFVAPLTYPNKYLRELRGINENTYKACVNIPENKAHYLIALVDTLDDAYDFAKKYVISILPGTKEACSLFFALAPTHKNDNFLNKTTINESVIFTYGINPLNVKNSNDITVIKDE